MDDVKILSINGQIKKTDFIEYALETKLLDLTDTSNTRRTLTDNTQDKSKPGRRKSIDVAQKVSRYSKNIHIECVFVTFVTVNVPEAEAKSKWFTLLFGKKEIQIVKTR